MGFPTRNYAFDIRNFGSGRLADGSNYLFVQPRPKYTYFAYFDIAAEAAPPWYQESVRSGKFLAALMSVGHPAMDYETEQLNTYNGVRVVPVRRKFKPLQVKFHDDSGSLVTNILKAYRSHYHYSGDATSADDFGDGLPMSRSGSRGGQLPSIGLKARSTRCFFNEITLYDLGTSPSHVNVYHIIRPTITSIDHDGLDYYETTGLVSVTLTLEYEGYHEELGVSIKEHSEALAQLGESPSDDQNDQVGGFTSRDIFGGMVDRITRNIPGIVSGAIGQTAFAGLKTGVLSNVAGGAINSVRAAVRQAAFVAEREATDLGRDAASGLVDGVTGFIPFLADTGIRRRAENVTARAVTRLMQETLVDGDAWLSKVDT